MDDISLKILTILQNKARIPNVEVARQIGLAPSAVLERIRKLEKQGFIDGYEVRLNAKKLHKSLAVFLEISLGDPTACSEIAQALGRLTDVQEIHYISGSDALLVKLRASSVEALHALIRKEVVGLPGVGHIRTKIVMETYKESAKIALDAILTEN